MSYSSGEAAEQVVRMTLNGVEVAAKISGKAAERLAVLLYAVLKDQKKTRGKTRLNSMLRSGKELKVFAIGDRDLEKFCREAKKYGILYCVLKDKTANDGHTDVFVRAEDASKINRIFDRFGMTAPVFPSDMESAKSIRKEAKKHGIDLLLIRQKHLGSDCLPNHIDGMCEALRERGVSIRTGEDVRHVIVEDGEVRGLITDKGELRCRAAILAPGRVGADWMGDMAKKYGMELQQRGIEVGVRVETHNDVMSDLTNVIYDPTFFVQTQRYDDQTRTFCTNPAGFITLENYQDFVCVNGHAYRNRKSDNTNFAFLSKVILTDPVSDSHGYGVAIGRLASLIGGGKPILQRLGDLRRGRRSTWQRIHNGYVEPTLTEVTPGDIAMALPGRIVTNLVEGLEQLNLVVPGIADDSTLLYAPEIKFFSTQVATSSDLETSVSNLFVAGDGPGVSGNIVSAAATGIIPAKAIVRKFGKGEGKE